MVADDWAYVRGLYRVYLYLEISIQRCFRDFPASFVVSLSWVLEAQRCWADKSCMVQTLLHKRVYRHRIVIIGNHGTPCLSLPDHRPCFGGTRQHPSSPRAYPKQFTISLLFLTQRPGEHIRLLLVFRSQHHTESHLLPATFCYHLMKASRSSASGRSCDVHRTIALQF